MLKKTVDKLYASTKDWVSVETELNRTIDPSTLFYLTEQDAGDRFYMRLNDNHSSYFGYHAVQRFKITLKISSLSLRNGKI